MADEKDLEKKGNTNQYAMIWNYYNHVGEVKNYFGGAASKDDLAEPDADKQKRQALIKTNKLLKLDGAPNDRKVDILKLYRFINKYFVGEIAHKYEWYALRRFLERNKLLIMCDNVEFAEHMNQEEWFGYAKKPCESNEMNIYNFLNSTPPDNWLEYDIPYGSRATKAALKSLYLRFRELEDNKAELEG